MQRVYEGRRREEGRRWNLTEWSKPWVLRRGREAEDELIRVKERHYY